MSVGGSWVTPEFQIIDEAENKGTALEMEIIRFFRHQPGAWLSQHKLLQARPTSCCIRSK